MRKKKITVQEIADVIDHSLLKPDLTLSDIKEGCELAKQYKCISVCVRPSDVPIAVEELKGSDVLVTTVIGFPHGTCTTETKVFEVEDAVKKGATEVDAVINIGRLLSGQYDYVEYEISKMAEAAHKSGAMLKIIFENYYLTDDQIIKCCEISKRAGADFIKTSTGYAGGGAKTSDLKLMVRYADGMKVKAAGGIRTLDTVLEMMAIGVSRIGTRSSKAILEEAMERNLKGELFIIEE